LYYLQTPLLSLQAIRCGLKQEVFNMTAFTQASCR